MFSDYGESMLLGSVIGDAGEHEVQVIVLVPEPRMSLVFPENVTVESVVDALLRYIPAPLVPSA